MKVRVTHKGINIEDKAIPVGTVLEVEGDTIPVSFINKVVVVSDDEGKTFIANPARPLTKSEKAAADKAERAELTESAKLLGVVVTDKQTIDEIKAAIEKAGQ